ncbi:MAG: hypothetical protein Q4G30_03435 [Actinomycetaceae bacterium]|nr:hypothetical protein [Actinomycetaceae bacterium]
MKKSTKFTAAGLGLLLAAVLGYLPSIASTNTGGDSVASPLEAVTVEPTTENEVLAGSEEPVTNPQESANDGVSEQPVSTVSDSPTLSEDSRPVSSETSETTPAPTDTPNSETPAENAPSEGAQEGSTPGTPEDTEASEEPTQGEVTPTQEPKTEPADQTETPKEPVLPTVPKALADTVVYVAPTPVVETTSFGVYAPEYTAELLTETHGTSGSASVPQGSSEPAVIALETQGTSTAQGSSFVLWFELPPALAGPADQSGGPKLGAAQSIEVEGSDQLAAVTRVTDAGQMTIVQDANTSTYANAAKATVKTVPALARTGSVATYVAVGATITLLAGLGLLLASLVIRKKQDNQ